MFKVCPRPPASTDYARLPFVSRPKTGPRVFLPDGIPQPESGDSGDNGRGRVGLLPCAEGITRAMIDGAGHTFDGQGGSLVPGLPSYGSVSLSGVDTGYFRGWTGNAQSGVEANKEEGVRGEVCADHGVRSGAV